MTTTTIRPELAPLPPRMQRLPLDARGYPVPWFVQWLNAKAEPTEPYQDGAYPEFRVMDQKKWRIAIIENRCWVCGDRMGAYKTFVVGPMCGINRTTAEPACHLECAEWSVHNCPFLARPHMERRDNDGLLDKLKGNVAGVMLERNPGVTLLWTCKKFKVWYDDRGFPLIEMGAPTAVRWYAEGRTATRAEVEESVNGGYPALYKIAEDQELAENVNAIGELKAKRALLEALYPEEVRDGQEAR